MRILFFLLIISLHLSIFFSAILTASAKESMTGKDSLLEIEPLRPGDNLPALNIEPSPTPIKKPARISPNNFGTLGFRFSVSSLLIDYGELSPTNPIIRENTISILNQASLAYTVLAHTDHELKDINGNFIPDTGCDNGACSERVAASFNNTLTFGFGYRCAGHDCLSDFLAKDYYKQFANQALNENSTLLASGRKSDQENVITIYYKVNTAASQPQSKYTNTITYLALPGY